MPVMTDLPPNPHHPPCCIVCTACDGESPPPPRGAFKAFHECLLGEGEGVSETMLSSPSRSVLGVEQTPALYGLENN